MTLDEFVKKVKEDNELNINEDKCLDFINKKAKKEAGTRSSIGIADETVKNWILEFATKKDDEPKQEKKEEKKEVTHEKVEQLRLL